MNKPGVMIGALGVAAAALGIAWAQDNMNHETVGQHFTVVASAMPPPFATPASAERSVKAQTPDPAKLQLPPELPRQSVRARPDPMPRWLQVAPNGDVFHSPNPRPGKITLLRDQKGDGTATMRTTYAEGFKNPHGMAIANGKFYIADSYGI